MGMRCAGGYSKEAIADNLMLVSNTPDTMFIFDTAEGRYQIRYVTPAATCSRSASKAVMADGSEEPTSCDSCKSCPDTLLRCVEIACFLNPCYRCISDKAAKIFVNI